MGELHIFSGLAEDSPIVLPSPTLQYFQIQHIRFLLSLVSIYKNKFNRFGGDDDDEVRGLNT
jgi:hypothetical protein